MWEVNIIYEDGDLYICPGGKMSGLQDPSLQSDSDTLVVKDANGTIFYKMEMM